MENKKFLKKSCTPHTAHLKLHNTQITNTLIYYFTTSNIPKTTFHKEFF